MRAGATRGGWASPRTEFVIAAFDDVDTSDPHRAYETGSRNLVANVYETLLDVNPATGALRPKLAERVPQASITPAGLVYRFHIRPGVRFHDGSPLTPSDVVYSLRRLLLLGTGAGMFWREALAGQEMTAASLEALKEAGERIRAEGNTVVVTIPRSYSPFLLLVANCSFILPAAWCAAAGDWSGSLHDPPPDPWVSPVEWTATGTGPYRLVSWDRPRRMLRFDRFGDYWGQRADVEHIVYMSIDDRLAREEALVRGSIDFAVCQPESLDRIRHSDAIHVAESPAEWSINPVGLMSFDLAPDQEILGQGEFSPYGMPRTALQDPNLRAALTYCFDYERFNREALAGGGVRHRGLLPRAALPDGPQPDERYDLNLARRHLTNAAGGAIAERGIRIVSYTHRDNVARERAAAILADGFNQLLPSARLEVRATTLGDLMSRLEQRRCPIGWIGWASDFCHPHASISPFLSFAWPLAQGLSIASLSTDAAVKAALRSHNATAAEQIYRQIARTVIDYRLMLFVPSKPNYRVFRTCWSAVNFIGGQPNVLDFAGIRWNTS